MRDFSTVYPLFDQKINKCIVRIHRSLEFDGHSLKTQKLLYDILESIEDISKILIDNPSIQLTNLGYVINDLYVRDRTVHSLQVVIHFKPDPDLDRTSKVLFRLYET